MSTLEAIAAICNPEGDLDVLGGVETLGEKNLLRQEEGVGGEPRYVLLETSHEYARERLAASGSAAERRGRRPRPALESALASMTCRRALGSPATTRAICWVG